MRAFGWGRSSRSVARYRPGGAPSHRRAIRLARARHGAERRPVTSAPLTQRLTAALKTIRHLRCERVLCLPDGSPVTRDRVIKAVRGAQRVAGIEQGVHILRHTFCSHLAMKGAPARAIQELAGHADLSTTRRYMHLSPVATEDAIRLLDGRQSGLERSEKFGDILDTPWPANE